MSERPLACSLSVEALARRASEARTLFREGLIVAEEAPGRLTLRFAEGHAERVEALAAAERECCGFLDIEVSRDGTALVLAAPEGGEAEVEAFTALATEVLSA